MTSKPKEEDKLDRAKILYQGYVDQVTHERDLMKKVPEMKGQVAVADRHLKILSRALVAVDAGYEPDSPTTREYNWYEGFLSDPKGGISNRQNPYALYARALPERVIIAYAAAQNMTWRANTRDNLVKVFDSFQVYTTDTSVYHFNAGTPSVKNIDVKLIGWVNSAPEIAKYDGKWTYYGMKQIVREVDKYGFLIGSWNLVADLAVSPILIAPPKEKLVTESN